MTAPELIALLSATRRHLLALAEDAGHDALDEPGVSGDYALKDVLAHLMAYERALVTWLDEAGAGRVYVDPVVDQPDLVARNAQVFAAYHDRPASDVLRDFAQTAEDVEARVVTLSERDLNDADASAWYVVPRWGRAQPLWRCIANDTIEHRQQHISDIERWIAARRSL